MLGTNDLKLGKSHITTFNNLKQAANIIHTKLKAHIAIIQIPPQQNMTTNTEIEMLNRTLQKHMHPTPIINTSQALSNKPLAKLLQPDGIHITETAALIISQQINNYLSTKTSSSPNQELTPPTTTHQQQTTYTNPTPTYNPAATNKTQPQTPTTPPHCTETYSVPADLAGHIIKKNEEGLKDLKRTFNTTITRENNTQNKTCTFTITGTNRNIQLTITKIKDIITNATHLRQQEHKTPICRFFTRGTCKYGPTCNFTHPSTTNPRRRSRTSSPEASSSKRHRSSSKTKQPKSKSSHKKKKRQSSSSSSSSSSRSSPQRTRKHKRTYNKFN